MQKRNVITHATVIGMFVAVSLGIFQAVGAGSNPLIASSSKFSGPTEPPSSFYSNGSVTVLPDTRTVIATPMPQAGLVVQSATYASDSSVPGLIEVFADAQNDPSPCTHSTAVNGGFFDKVQLPAGETVNKDFLPGITLTAGDELCTLISGAAVMISVMGYNIPATASVHSDARRAVPNIK
jgi:hypothetical protein